jgi:metal-responsive CopG/Arc/MetJ family transcriptional regulator
MEQVRVNLTLEREIWKRLDELVPNRKKSNFINDLLKSEIAKRIRQNEEETLSMAFEEASKDKERQATIREWKSLDAEEWD